MILRPLALPLLALASCGASTTAEPPVDGYRIVREYPHDPTAFTQGLIFLDGRLYESTGLNRQSTIREVRLEDGKVLRSVDIAPLCLELLGLPAPFQVGDPRR